MLLGLLALVPARQVLEARGRVAELEREASRIERENAALRAEIVALDDPVELERLARACLGMVRPGEIALIVPGGPADEAC
jgi:cell division protein FtsB